MRALHGGSMDAVFPMSRLDRELPTCNRLASMNRGHQFVVLFVGGLLYSFIVYRALMWAVWGAPTHPIQYVALGSALGLMLSAFVALAYPNAGRWLSIFCTLGIGTYCIPATQSLVPSATQIIFPIAFLLIGGYFALLAFCLFFPRRKIFSIPIMAGALLVGVGFGAQTLLHRITDGEFRRPAIAYFEWTPSDADLHVTGSEYRKWLTDDMLSTLSSQGFEGSLRWRGSQGSSKSRPRMLVLAKGPIPENKRLYYPKGDYVIYVFTTTGWTMIPDDAELYSSFATLETDGMIYQTTSGGGRQGTSAFRW